MKSFPRFAALFGALVALLSVLSFAHADPPHRVRLIVWGLPSGRDTAGTDAQIAAFQRLNPDIEVSNLSMGAGEMNPQKLMTSIVGAVPPDVVRQDRFTIGDWASRGTFQPLDTYLAQEKNDASGVQASHFYPAAWNEAIYKGSVYAIPTGIDDRMLLYNRKIFREAGLDPNKPPRTWDELAVYAKKLTKYNSDGTYARIGFIPNYGNSWLYLYAWQNRGEFMSPDGRTCTLASPENVGALEYMVQVYDSLGGLNKVNTFQSGFQTGELDPFLTGKVAMVINGNWVLNNVARYAPNLDFAAAPPPIPAERLAQTGRFAGVKPPFLTWTGGFSFAIPVGARHSAEAWRFIKWMSSHEAYRVRAAADKAYNISKGRPFVFELSADRTVNGMLMGEFAPGNPNLRGILQQYIDMLPNARYRPVTFVGQSLWDAHVRAFDRATADVQGGNGKIGHLQTPQQSMLEQQKLVQRELDKAFARENLPLLAWKWPVALVVAASLGLMVFGVFRVRSITANSRMARKEALAGYLFASPWILGFTIFTLGPIIASIFFAFCDYDVLHAPRYAGMTNFNTLFGDDRELLGKALGNVAYLGLIGIPLGMCTGLAIAMLLNQKVKGMTWFRTAFYIPSIVPAIASAVLWSWLLSGDPNKGLINALWKTTLTEWFGWLPPGWFGVPEWSKPGLIFQGLWGAGGGMILWLAGLQGVSPNLYEAASIDGATGWSRFRHVTVPMLSPYIFFNLVIGLIGAIQEFDRVYVLAGGTGGTGPLDSLIVPVLYLFNNAFRYFKMGYASAIAWVIFVIILLLTMIQWQAQKYWVHYETDKK